ncbi:hypothetical protein AMTRI_Chr09g20280 [Amborella trichopoda]
MGSFLGLRKGTERHEKENNYNPILHWVIISIVKALWVVVGCFSMVKALSRLWLVVSLLPKLSRLWLPYSIAKALWVMVGCFSIAKGLSRLWLVVSLLSNLFRLWLVVYFLFVCSILVSWITFRFYIENA